MVRAGRNLVANSACGLRGGLGGKSRKLYVARHVEIVLQPLFLLGHPAVQPGIFDGHGNLRGERHQGALVIVVEVVDPHMLQVEHADHLALVEQRHRHLRASLGIHHVVARIFAHVAGVDQPALAHRSAHQASIQRDCLRRRYQVAEAHRILNLQHLLPFIHQQNAEHLVIDEPPQELSDALQQGIEIENRGNLAGDFIEHRQGLRLPGHARIEARILDRLGHARSGQFQ